MENKFCCRFQRITIQNLKNVVLGDIRFSCNYDKSIIDKHSDILGIYGPNGSGKTTFIFAIELFKQLLSGRRLPDDFDKYISVGAETAQIEYEISLERTGYEPMLVKYGVIIKRKNTIAEINSADNAQDNHSIEPSVFVSQEWLKYKKIYGKKGQRPVGIVEYSCDGKGASFSPDDRYKEYIRKDKTLINDLKYLSREVYFVGASFIFSLGRIEGVRERQGFSDEIMSIIDSIQLFAASKLLVLSNVQSSMVNANIVLPMTFSVYNDESKSISQYRTSIRLTAETVVDSGYFGMIEKRFKIIDGVISSIIPGLSIRAAIRGSKIDDNGKDNTIFEILSTREEKEIPLRYESDGIKKLVYVLYGLIEMYNDESVTVAIDELDSGVFEYLLGEVMIMLQEYAKGQLIFTSHNLRALEVLHKKSVVFSTTNNLNRYIRFKYVKESNNLRDVYYQSILLGGQDECVYEPTNQSDMRRAFRKAGMELNG